VTNPTASATWAVERNWGVANLERCVIWSRDQAAARDQRCAETRADRDVEEIVNSCARAERALAEDRNLRIVLKKRRESECRANRSCEVSSWECRTKVGGFNCDAGPWVNWPWGTDPNADKSRDGCCVFACSKGARKRERAHACLNNCSRPFGDRCACRSSTDP
jgi:hypothetical protein